MSHNWKEYVGDKNFYRSILKIAIPVSAQQLITVGINLMDTVMLSSMGDIQLSAAAQAGQFINLFQIFCMGIGMGASVLTARFWGMEDKISLRKAVTIMLRIVLAFATVFFLATLCFPKTIMLFYTSNEETIRYGVSYLQWILPTYYCMGLSLTCTIVLRSVGEVRIPLISSFLSFFINIFFNWVFIFGKLGAPRMEIAGAALGTLIARIFELLFICGFFILKDSRIEYRFHHLAMPCRNLLREYFRISIPVLVSDGLLALGNNSVAMIMGRIGDTFVAANSVTMVVQQLSSVLTQGVSNASGIITGHTMGRGEYDKAQKQGYTFLLLGALVGFLAAAAILLLRTPIIGYYQVSQQAKEISFQLMDAISFIIIFQAMNSILTKGVLRAGGDTKFLMAGDILFLWVASIPLGMLAGLVWHWPPFWIYSMLKIDQILKCVWCFFRLRSRKWMKKISAAPAEEKAA
ncbi:MAG: MATE family efflux transporter [Provencibacterium sp.]|nr:MATE family efflux transporter [Provencibacterium sp.]